MAVVDGDTVANVCRCVIMYLAVIDDGVGPLNGMIDLTVQLGVRLHN